MPGFPASLKTGRAPRHAFTLVEILVVMGVMVVLIALAGPAVNAIKGSGDVNKAVYDLAGILTQARTYAMSNSTYVYVGIEEVDSSQSSSATPQATGTGRVGIAVIASKDGTSRYSLSAPGTSWSNNYRSLQGSDFLTIGRLQTFDNLHLINLGARPTSGGLARPPLNNTDAIDYHYNLGDAMCISVTPFAYPLGLAQGVGRYNFTKVIAFSPQGVARIQYDDTSDIVAPWLEIGLQQSHGNTAAPSPAPQATTGNIVAIQINGATGSVRIYRP